MKKAAVLLSVFAFIIVILPAIVVLPYSQDRHAEKMTEHQPPPKTRKQEALTVSVYRSAAEKAEKVALDDYLIGVVGSEMPADFHLEALKAQALAARTYIINRIMKQPDGRVTDTVENQVYHNRTEFKRLWGADYDRKIRKVKKAVAETENQVITYKGELISPAFFSTSNGRTENAQDYWQSDIPYLRSVASPWDRQSPKFKTEKTLKISDVEAALGIRLSDRHGELGRIVEKTETGYVAAYKIGGKTFTGRQLREKLHLSSADFQLRQNGSQVLATTYGSGHGIGMSQYGAEGMAAEGKKAEQIVTYYYKGTEISKINLSDKKEIVKK
ncbi:stage II sporulation protein D [Sporolactobacillus sp. THM7-7]|nr:stage II sporulation protein D [Sporolactobacillus sp. THM7-7]